MVTPATKPATSSIGSALTQVRGLQVEDERLQRRRHGGLRTFGRRNDHVFQPHGVRLDPLVEIEQVGRLLAGRLFQVSRLQVLVELGQHILGDAARLDDSIPGMPESLAPFTAGAACP